MIDVDRQTKKIMESLEDKWFTDGFFFHRTKTVLAFGVKNDILHIVGIAGEHNQLYFEIRSNLETGSMEEICFEPNEGPGLISAFTFSLYDKLPGTKKRRQQTMAFWKLRNELKDINQEDIKKKLEKISIVRGMTSDGKISDSKDAKFFETLDIDDELHLKITAHRARADSIIFVGKIAPEKY